MIREKKVFIKDIYGNKIPGIYIPGDTKKAVLLIAHGLMGDKNEYLNTTARIAQNVGNDIASLRIDFFGHGESKVKLSAFNFSSQVGNLCAAIEWLQKKGYSKIIGMGVSYGAPPILQITELYNHSIISCILIAPVIDFKLTFVNPITNWGKDFFGYDRIIKGILKGGLPLEENYLLSNENLLNILNLDIGQLGKRIKQPITIYHGNKDDMVPLDASLEFARHNNNVEIVIMKDTEHGITEAGDETFHCDTSFSNLKMITKKINELA